MRWGFARRCCSQPQRNLGSASQRRVPLISLKDGDVHYSYRKQQQKVSVAGEGVPLVLLGGTSQTISSFVAHAGTLAKTRPLLQYETRGQGRHTSLPLEDCSLANQVADFDSIMTELEHLHGVRGPVDLCGFSFGGRLAMAIAASFPHRVRRLVVTGVPAQRGAQGRAILKSWESVLQSGNLEAWVWQSIADGHSRAFLEQWEGKLPVWARAAAAMNRAEAIAAIVAQTHVEDEEDPFHTVALAKALAAQGTPSFFIGGDEDRIARPEEVSFVASPCAAVVV